MQNDHGSSRPEVFCKKGVLTNFTKFAGNSPVPESLFNKVADLSFGSISRALAYSEQFIQAFSRILRHIQPHSHARN